MYFLNQLQTHFWNINYASLTIMSCDC